MTTNEQRQTRPVKVDALLDLRIRIADEIVLNSESCMMATKQRVKVFLTGVSQGLDTTLAFIDEALEAEVSAAA
jgi:hypothetical protein